MRCPFCMFAEDKVIDTRSNEAGNAIRRRRECLNCGKRFTTFEKIEETPLMVIKKDGARELFDSGKLLRGIMKACEKRPVSSQVMQEIVHQVELESRNELKSEISVNEIGEIVMRELKKQDEVAYVRFASVYRQFKDIQSFMEELQSLLVKERKDAP